MGTKAYDLQSLLPLNKAYDYEHHLNSDDVNLVNETIEHIKLTRSADTPKVGDRLIYVSEYGDYANNAVIERIDDGECSICINSYAPFVWKKPDGIGCSVSGGPFTHVPLKELKFAGHRKAYYKDWGHCGSCANGAVVFAAEVNLWEYRHPKPLYGDFTTKEWRKIYISKMRKPTCDYTYFGDCIAFRTDEEFEKFLRDFEAVTFEGLFEGSIIVWCYRDIVTEISEKEWEALDAPTESRRIYNTQQPVKIVKNHDTHERISYYVKPKLHFNE